jgi:wobble nucleotide-excising tRNase
VVVIDDPVSSLDANSLFSAFAYLSKRAVGAIQLILLTHNFLFLKQVKDWFKYLDKPKGTCNYYMIENYQEDSGRAAKISPMDPLLKEYQSEYHYMFRKVIEGSQQAVGLPLENYYGLPNVARRLLEVFLGFRYPSGKGFKSRLEMTSVEPATLARIRRFVHTYSHEEGDGEDMDTTMLAEAPVVLGEILDLIRAEDARHFDQMMSLCAPGNA